MPISIFRPGALSPAVLVGIFAGTDAVLCLMRQADYIRETEASSVADGCPDRIAALPATA